jgi:hypothetical protein
MIGHPDFGQEYERNTHIAHVFACVLIAGLLFELVNSVIWYRGWETIAGMASVLLIAVGVWGEVFFGNRARVAGDKQLGEYRARAAEAEVELARLATPRVRLLTPEASASIIEKIEPFRGTMFDMGLPHNGREQWDLAWVLEPLISQAGWEFVDWIGGISRIPKFNWTMQRHWYGVANVSNVVIELTIENREPLLPAARALVDALNAVGIAAKVEDNPISGTSITPDAISILIGPKE